MLNHQKTARYCLKIQGKDIKTPFKCNGCGLEFAHKYKYNAHAANCFILKEQTFEDAIAKLQEDIEERDMKIKNQKAEFEKKEKKYRAKIHALEKRLSKEEGKTEVLSSQPKTVNNYVNSKLLTVTTDTIRPFTIETVKEEIESGGYTREMFNRGTLGIVEFVSNMISHENADGTIERNYVCTDVSRSKFHRLLESKEWKSDNGAHFLNGVLDYLSPYVEELYQDIVSKRRDAQINEDEVEYEYYNNRVDESRSLYQGVKFKKGEDRDKLFVSLRNKISRIAAV